jgi:hypothetical protein
MHLYLVVIFDHKFHLKQSNLFVIIIWPARLIRDKLECSYAGQPTNSRVKSLIQRNPIPKIQFGLIFFYIIYFFILISSPVIYPIWNPKNRSMILLPRPRMAGNWFLALYTINCLHFIYSYLFIPLLVI